MVRIRDATPADEPALRRLEAASPQGTRSRLAVERATFFYRSALLPGARVLLAEEGNGAVGVLAFAPKEVFVGGEPVRVVYVYDLRSDPSYRRSMKRGLWELWTAVEEEARGMGAPFLYGHVKGDNVDALRVFAKGGGWVAGEFEVLTLPTRPGPVRLSSLPDPKSAVSALAEALGPRDLRPLSLPEVYAQGAELGYLRGVFRLKRGRSFAQVSVWDCSSVFQQRVLVLPLEYRLLGLLLNPLARVLPIPRVPVPGQALRFWHLFDVWVEGRAGPWLLRRLLGDLSHRARTEGVDLLALFRSAGDPLVRLPPLLLKETLRYRTVIRDLGGRRPAPPLYLDIRDL
ncbi:MAG: GNAT family N-acetyltransferase [Candidatus Bipolaricaulota bacterium]|nr:GNAT family N-acetyltransferase [Candidatus Bipolaricaulota bacterium]